MSEPSWQDFVAEVAEQGPTAIRVACALGIVAFVTFGFVDPLLMDGGVGLAVVLRAATIFSLLALSLTTVSRRFTPAAIVPVSAASCVVIGGGVIGVTLLAGGGESRYHEALLLTFFGFALLPVPWRPWLAISLFAGLVAVYDFAMVVGDVTGPLGIWVSTNAILWSAVLIAGVMVSLSMRLRWAGFQSRWRLAEANERLTALDEAKSRFFDNLSHELRTPLTLALAPVQSLLDETAGPLTSVQRENLKLVERNALRLLKLLDDLLELSKAQGASLNLSKERLDLAELVADLVEQVAPLARRKRLDVKFESAGDADAAGLRRSGPDGEGGPEPAGQRRQVHRRRRRGVGLGDRRPWRGASERDRHRDRDRGVRVAADLRAIPPSRQLQHPEPRRNRDRARARQGAGRDPRRDHLRQQRPRSGHGPELHHPGDGPAPRDRSVSLRLVGRADRRRGWRTPRVARRAAPAGGVPAPANPRRDGAPARGTRVPRRDHRGRS